MHLMLPSKPFNMPLCFIDSAETCSNERYKRLRVGCPIDAVLIFLHQPWSEHCGWWPACTTFVHVYWYMLNHMFVVIIRAQELFVSYICKSMLISILTSISTSVFMGFVYIVRYTLHIYVQYICCITIYTHISILQYINPILQHLTARSLIYHIDICICICICICIHDARTYHVHLHTPLNYNSLRR